MILRGCGILLPVSSLASAYGIGCFSREAYEFVDFLKKAGQSCWQVLPFGPTGFGDSPYQSVSAFAGNPYYIDPETLIRDGLLTRQECDSFFWGSNQERVDYGALFENRLKLLRIAFGRFRDVAAEDSEYQEFVSKESYWLADYALYMAIKGIQGGRSWLDWDENLKKRDPDALTQAREDLQDEIGLYCFIQYEFDRQWKALHAYAAQTGIEIIGDLPYYVAMDSADSWAHPEAFEFDKDLNPIRVAGCPPDAFSPTGQLWGNPVYNWKALKKNHYDWWIRRMERSYELYDIVRIDHFNGFDTYYAVPFEDKTAEKGTTEKGPGMDFFRTLKKQLGDVRIIAEDLGTVTPSTEKLLADTGFPGMNVLQYAFDWTEYSYYMTHNHRRNSVVYTGTHDNKTTRQWIEELGDHDRDLARRYIHSENTDYGAFTWDFIREAYRSVASLCMIPLQDYLVKGSEARMNTPGTQGSNWQWRLAPHYLSDDLARSIYALAKLYGRLPEKKN